MWYHSKVQTEVNILDHSTSTRAQHNRHWLTRDGHRVTQAGRRQYRTLHTHRTCGVYLPQPRTSTRADEIVDGRGGPAVGAMDCDEHPSASSARHSRAPTIKLLSWQHAWPPAWSWRRKWARCAAARCRCSLNSPAAFCRTVRCHLTTTEGRGRVTPNPLDTTTFEESNVRASEAMPGGMVSVISRTGSASSQKTSTISKEPPQQHAPAGAVSASRSSATGRNLPN